MFIGREFEIRELNRLYDTDTFQFAVMYGRRRVGKTTIINEFIRDKDVIYFTGVESNEKQNLANFSRSIIAYETGHESELIYPSFQSAFEQVFRLAEQKRIILVIDEYPYVARSSGSLASTLQMLIDRNRETSKLFIILCGSSMSYMEDEVLSYKAPLYGRKTAQFKIQPFDFEESCEYLSGFSDNDKALIYGILGGTPQYLSYADPASDIEDNIRNLYLKPTSPMFDEPGSLIKLEMKDPTAYTAIISAVADGYTKLGDIASRAGISTALCANNIKQLISLGIIRKELPIGEQKTKKTIYSLEDNMFKFWYRFIPENISAINLRAADTVYTNRVAPFLSEYMGYIFEDIAKQYLWKLLIRDECPVRFTTLGRWWGADPRRKTETEIDIMGIESRERALFGECKWTNKPVDKAVLDLLLDKGEMFAYPDKYYYLFSKSGFTEGCIEAAADNSRIRLVSYEDILRKQPEQRRNPA